MTKEHPILFSGRLVLAILEGRKTETRRIAKLTDAGHVKEPRGNRRWHPDDPAAAAACPFGQPGARLWVRERQRVVEIRHGRDFTDEGTCHVRVRYEADGAESGWLPYPDRLNGDPVEGRCLAYGGYRESSRINLGVVEVRAERIQEITKDGVIAEGISSRDGFPLSGVHAGWHEPFAELWDEINGKRAPWAANPWVWVVRFLRVEAA